MELVPESGTVERRRESAGDRARCATGDSLGSLACSLSLSSHPAPAAAPSGISSKGEVVAIKKMKKLYRSWEECVQLREVASLRALNSHPNIVQLKEVIRENNELFFVFEFLDQNIYQM